MVLTPVWRPAAAQGSSGGLSRAGAGLGAHVRGCWQEASIARHVGLIQRQLLRPPGVAAAFPRASDPRDSESEASVSSPTARRLPTVVFTEPC